MSTQLPTEAHNEVKDIASELLRLYERIAIVHKEHYEEVDTVLTSIFKAWSTAHRVVAVPLETTNLR
jgi:hypothetical protein